MSEWKHVTVRALCSHVIDCRNKTAPVVNYPTPYKMLRTSNIRNGFVDISSVRYVTKQTYDIWTSRGELEDGDVIFTREAPLGEVGILRTADGYFLGQRLVLFRSNPQKCYNWFLNYALLSPWIKNKICGSGGGSIVTHLRVPDCEEIQIRIPADLSEQRRIADTLRAIDEKIELNQQINDNLEAMAQALYDYWFVQFDFPDENGKPYKSSGGKMVWNDKLKREIPEGWDAHPLFDVASVLYGYPFKTELFTENKKDLPVIRIRDILDNTFSAYSCESIHEKYLTRKGDLLIGMDGNFHLNYWYRDGDGVNQRVVRSCTSTVSNIQLKLELAPYIKMREMNVTRSTVGHLSDKDFKERYILVATESSTFNPAKVLNALLERMTSLVAETQKLTKQRDFLLPLLMNGQVQVKPQGELNYHFSAKAPADAPRCSFFPTSRRSAHPAAAFFCCSLIIPVNRFIRQVSDSSSLQKIATVPGTPNCRGKKKLPTE